MLEVELLKGGTTPRFRITGDRSIAKVLSLMVHEADSETLLWVLGPPGMVVSQELAFTRIEERQASDTELRQMRAAAEGSLGGSLVEVCEVTYGSVPDGFHQSIPDTGTAPPLAPGRRYVLFAVGPMEVGSAEFTA